LGHPADYVVGVVFGNDADHDPAVALLQHFKPADVLDVLGPIRAVLVAVVLDGDLDVLPAHIQIRFGPSPFVAHGDLRLRPRKARPQQKQAKPRFFRGLGAAVDEF
jgi:hypothetical protein